MTMSVPQITQYDAYLFDWDGTLTRTLEAWLDILRANYGKYGLFPDDAALVASFGVKDAEASFGMASDKIEQFRKDIEAAWYEAFDAPPLYEGIAELLPALKRQGKKLALITNSLRGVVQRDLATHRLLDLFDLVITGHDVKRRKPDPEALFLALEKLNVTCDRALMIGDSDKDILAAKAAGVDSVLFYPPTHELFYDRAELELHKPTFVIQTWRELHDLLQ